MRARTLSCADECAGARERGFCVCARHVPRRSSPRGTYVWHFACAYMHACMFTPSAWRWRRCWRWAAPAPASTSSYRLASSLSASLASERARWRSLVRDIFHRQRRRVRRGRRCKHGNGLGRQGHRLEESRYAHAQYAELGCAELAASSACSYDVPRAEEQRNLHTHTGAVQRHIPLNALGVNLLRAPGCPLRADRARTWRPPHLIYDYSIEDNFRFAGVWIRHQHIAGGTCSERASETGRANTTAEPHQNTLCRGGRACTCDMSAIEQGTHCNAHRARARAPHQVKGRAAAAAIHK